MDKEISSFNHNISLTERKNIIISGVKKIENFDDHEFLLETTMGFLLINGKKDKDDSLFTKLFKW